MLLFRGTGIDNSPISLMPFTFAHPAAVLPLRRFCQGRLVWSAMMIGTLAPDLEYFIRLTPNARLTGSMRTGLLWDLAGGLLLFVLFHSLVKRPATLLLPARHRRALWPVAVETVRRTIGRDLAIGASLLIGAGTHRLWDGFTHRDGWAVAHIASLQVHVVDVGSYQVTVFKLLQHGSTLVGFGVLAVVYLFWFKRLSCVPSVQVPAMRPGIRLGAIAAVLLSSLSIGVVNALLASSSPHVAVRAFVVHLGIGAIAGGTLAVVALGLAFRVLGDRMLTDQHR